MTERLAGLQREIVDLIFAAEPTAHLAAIRARYPADAPAGQWARWSLHRRMARARIREIVAAAAPRTVAWLGEEAFGALVDRWFSSRRPATLYVRELIEELTRFVDDEQRTLLGAFGVDDPRWIEMLRCEAALRRVSHVEVGAESSAADDGAGGSEVRPFAMELPVLVDPAHARLSLSAPLHLLDESHTAAARAAIAPRATELLLHRNAETGLVDVLELDARAAQLFDALASPDAPSVVSAAQRVAERAGIALDGAFVAALSEVLGDWLERGLIIGAR